MTRPTTASVRELAGFKEPCYLATTANVDLASGTLLTIDSVVTTAGDRILVKNQTDASENGIYLASAGEWYRAPDAMSSRNLAKRVYVAVQAGSNNAGTVWVFDTLAPDLGTSNITITEVDFGGGGGGGTVDYATVAETRSAATGDKVLVSELIETASAFVALTDAASIAFNWDAGLNLSVTLGDNRTLANPTNGQPGTWRTVIVTQDGTGSRTLAFGDQYKFPGGDAPVLSTAIGSVDVFSILCVSGTNFFVFSAYDMSA